MTGSQLALTHDVEVAVGDDWALPITFLDGTDPLDISGETFTAGVYDTSGTLLLTLTQAVSGAGSNILTVSTLDIALPVSPLYRYLVRTSTLADRGLVGGRFSVRAETDTTTYQTGTPPTVNLSGGITLTLNVGAVGATGPSGAGGAGGTPASSVVAETALNGAASAVGASTNFARQDHTHGTPGMPSAADVGAQPFDADLTALANANNSATLAATTAAFTTADESKLDGIEAGAQVVNATNVTAAGALMDSEVTNLADVKAFDPADHATAAQGTLADAALPKVQTFRTVAGTTDTLVIGDMDNIVRSTGASACSITVPPAASVAWVAGRSIRIRGAGAGIVTLVQGSGVTLNATPSLVFRAQHSEAVITYVGSDVWDVSGDMATP